MKKTLLLIFICTASLVRAENGYRLWLRYDLVKNATLRHEYIQVFAGVQANGNSATWSVIREEVTRGLHGLLGKSYTNAKEIGNNFLVIGTPATADLLMRLPVSADL